MEMLFKLPKNYQIQKDNKCIDAQPWCYLFSVFESYTVRDEEGYIGNLGSNIYPDLQSSIGSNRTIGLMRRIGTIVVAKSTRLTPIAVTILTGKNDDPLEKWLSDKLKTVLSMPGILNSEKKEF